jgi:hypothetical protein
MHQVDYTGMQQAVRSVGAAAGASFIQHAAVRLLESVQGCLGKGMSCKNEPCRLIHEDVLAERVHSLEVFALAAPDAAQSEQHAYEVFTAAGSSHLQGVRPIGRIVEQTKLEGFVYGIKFGTLHMRAVIDKLEVVEPAAKNSPTPEKNKLKCATYRSKRKRLGIKLLRSQVEETRKLRVRQTEAALRAAYSLEASRGSTLSRLPQFRFWSQTPSMVASSASARHARRHKVDSARRNHRFSFDNGAVKEQEDALKSMIYDKRGNRLS